MAMNPYKAARRTAGLTQDQACERLYIGRSTIHRYEKGEPPIDVVVQMDRLYGCGGKLIRQRIENISFSRTKKSTVLTAIKTVTMKIFSYFSITQVAKR